MAAKGMDRLFWIAEPLSSVVGAITLVGILAVLHRAYSGTWVDVSTYVGLIALCWLGFLAGFAPSIYAKTRVWVALRRMPRRDGTIDRARALLAELETKVADSAR